MTPATARRVKLAFVAGGMALIVTRLLLAPAAELSEPDAAAPRRARNAPPKAPAPASAAAATELMTAQLDALRNDPGNDEDIPSAPGDATLFSPHSWQPPPPPAPAPAPPAPPQAPPFPYAYFGGLSDGGVRTAFFLNGNRVIALRSGDVIGSFRIDSLDEQQATMTYLPLSQTVTVPFGSSR